MRFNDTCLSAYLATTDVQPTDEGTVLSITESDIGELIGMDETGN